MTKMNTTHLHYLKMCIGNQQALVMVSLLDTYKQKGDQPFRVNQQELVKALKIALPSVRRAIRKLQDINLIYETNTYGCYGVNEYQYYELLLSCLKQHMN